MKQIMKIAMFISIAAMMAACSSTEVVRTRKNDPMMRVIIDPTVDVAHYVQIRRALVQSGKFEVIDRQDGFAAALQEQDLQFRTNNEDRFDPSEKWAHIGRMFGARGIITAHAQCFQQVNWRGIYTKYCKQELAFIDAYTGRVEFAVRGENDEPWVVGYSVPDWDEVVARAVTEYPKFFEVRRVDPLLEQYQGQSAELSKRENAKKKMKSIVPASVPAVPDSAQYNQVEQDVDMMSQQALKSMEASDEQ